MLNPKQRGHTGVGFWEEIRSRPGLFALPVRFHPLATSLLQFSGKQASKAGINTESNPHQCMHHRCEALQFWCVWGGFFFIRSLLHWTIISGWFSGYAECVRALLSFCTNSAAHPVLAQCGDVMSSSDGSFFSRCCCCCWASSCVWSQRSCVWVFRLWEFSGPGVERWKYSIKLKSCVSRVSKPSDLWKHNVPPMAGTASSSPKWIWLANWMK